MDKNWFSYRSHGQLILLLVILGYIFLMLGNGRMSLTHPDEVFYIQSAKEMVKHNSWLTPMIFDKPQFEKPILSYQLFAIAIKYFGNGPFVARFWPSFFGILGVCVTYWIAWMLFGRKQLAFLAGMILCTSFIYFALSRAVLTDMIFSIWVTITFGFFYLAYRFKKYEDVGLIFFFIFAAISVLTKGLLGIILPVVAITIFLWSKRDLGFLKKRSVIIGMLLFILIVLPWHWLMYQKYGKVFIDEYFNNVHVRRILEAEHAKSDHWYFYPMMMFVGVMPWSFFWFPVVALIIQSFRKRNPDLDKIKFLLAWMGTVFVVLQIAHSKLASYIFPLYPTIAILFAHYLDQVIEGHKTKSIPVSYKICVSAMAVWLLVIAIGGVVYGMMKTQDIVPIGIIVIFSFLLSGLAIFKLISIFKGKSLRAIFSYVGIDVVLLSVLLFAQPHVEPWVSCKNISEAFKKIDQSDSVILTSKFYVRGVRYYTDRSVAVIDINGKGFFSPHPIPFLDSDQKVLDFLAQQKVTYAIVKEGNVKDLKRIIEGKPYFLEELTGSGGKYILRIQKT